MPTSCVSFRLCPDRASRRSVVPPGCIMGFRRRSAVTQVHAATIRKCPQFPQLKRESSKSRQRATIAASANQTNSKKDSRQIRGMASTRGISGILSRGELKELISLIRGRFPDAIRKVERERCPGAVSQVAFGRFGNSPGRRKSVCQELAARGADRLSATMKRGTGLSLRPRGLWREPR